VRHYKSNPNQQRTHLLDLTVFFYVSLFLILFVYLIGLYLFVFRSHEPAVQLLFLTAIASVIAAVPATLYSYRELALNAEWFFFLSQLNHFGSILFLFSLAALLWCYPKPLSYSSLIPWLLPCLVLLVFGLSVWHNFYVYVHLLIAFILLCFFAYRQWLCSADSLLDRAALQWMLLSILGCGLLVTLALTLPALFGLPAFLFDQSEWFLCVVFMFLGLVFAVTRYELFNIGYWWWQAWLWLISGLFFILIDVLLLSVWGLSSTLAVPIAIALLAWVYFPVRQWLWKRFLLEPLELERFLPTILEALVHCRSARDIEATWQGLLKKVFEPLKISSVLQTADKVALVEQGQCLYVPHLQQDGVLCLQYAYKGKRLFRTKDQQFAESLLSIVQRSLSALEAKEEGIEEERDRIKREMHDGLGAKLMAMMHNRELPVSSQLLAQDAWRELRAIISSMEGESLYIPEVLAAWQRESRRLLSVMHIPLQWQQQLSSSASLLSSEQILNMGRCLSEGIQNAIRHGEAKHLKVLVVEQDEGLHLSLSDDGIGGDPEAWEAGRGILHIRQRMTALGGDAKWKMQENGGIILQLFLPVARSK